MSAQEGFPEATEDQAAPESIFRADGSLDEEVLGDRFGIGAEEALQEVSFGGHTGTVAQMLDDEECPVGAMVGAAYEENGIQGVAEKFEGLHALDPNFSVTIAPATMQREQVKKK